MTWDQQEAYNPLAKQNLAESIALALHARPVLEFPPDRFLGAGIYALYYLGDLPIYGGISSQDCESPIYIGSALPEGGRTGGLGFEDIPPTRSLHRRLRDHLKSIDQAENLRVEDFRFRFLVLDDVWVPLAEQHLIYLYRPIWNTRHLDGFGIHDPGKGRLGQRRSLWDELHPGRGHAKDRSAARHSAQELERRVAAYLSGELAADFVEPESAADSKPESEGE